MIEVVFRAYGPVRDALGAKTVECELPAGATVGDLLAKLTDEHPELDRRLYGGGLGDDDPGDGGLSDAVSLTVNGTNVSRREGLETELSAGDEVRVAPPIHGG
ncbi:ubiquitin-like small modifier protein 1 [Halorubrum sp. F4]|uniref:ubiquitin-like small modifier protein 1 n=1 Tax=Halorubrum sp. F4 TaxID=2989715 RepID=UPI0024800FDE|nr:ubiquitin-like small modifier protein 1 [Halorubrum sp. F4]